MTTRKFLLGAASLVVLMALLHVSANDVVAQIKSAYMKNLDEPGRIPYQHLVTRQRNSFLNCGDTFCTFHFPPVPAGKRLVLEQVSMRLGPSGATEFLLGIGIEGSPQNPNPVYMHLNTITNIVSVSAAPIFRESVRFYFEPGTQPALGVKRRFKECFMGAKQHSSVISSMPRTSDSHVFNSSR